MPKKVPLTVLQRDGSRRVIGEAEIDDTGVFITATVTDPEIAKKVFGALLPEQYSVAQHHNVFDHDKEA